MGRSIKRFDKPQASEKNVGIDWTTTIGIAGSNINSVAVTPTNETDPAGDVDVLGAVTFDANRNLTQFIAKDGVQNQRYKFRTVITLVNGLKYAENVYMDVT